MTHCLVQMLTLCSNIWISLYTLVSHIGKTHIYKHDSGSCGWSREHLGIWVMQMRLLCCNTWIPLLLLCIVEIHLYT
mgnify:CR=1 FL=1